MGELSVLKIGGSVISDKKGGGGIREEEVRAIARELSRLWPKPLLIVHGAGSYGHPLASEYKVAEGYKTPRNLEGFVKTSVTIRWLNSKITSLLIEGGLPCFSVPASSIFQTRGDEIEGAELETIFAALDIGLVPVTCGDVVFDRKKKFTVLSGDSIAVYLAKRIGAKRLVFATDVDGVYGIGSSGERVLINELKRGLHLRVRYEDVGDVTGGMAAKIDEAFEAVDVGIEVSIINGLYPERVAKALTGQEVRGTRLVRG